MSQLRNMLTLTPGQALGQAPAATHMLFCCCRLAVLTHVNVVCLLLVLTILLGFLVGAMSGWFLPTLAALDLLILACVVAARWQLAQPTQDSRFIKVAYHLTQLLIVFHTASGLAIVISLDATYDEGGDDDYNDGAVDLTGILRVFFAIVYSLLVAALCYRVAVLRALYSCYAPVAEAVPMPTAKSLDGPKGGLPMTPMLTDNSNKV